MTGAAIQQIPTMTLHFRVENQQRKVPQDQRLNESLPIELNVIQQQKTG
jgi:hypothetical protein